MIINTREDLDSLLGTEEYDNFISLLKGSLIQKTNIQVYPDDYNQPDYVGEALEPIWLDVEDLSTIERFGFGKEHLI